MLPCVNVPAKDQPTLLSHTGFPVRHAFAVPILQTVLPNTRDSKACLPTIHRKKPERASPLPICQVVAAQSSGHERHSIVIRARASRHGHPGRIAGQEKISQAQGAVMRSTNPRPWPVTPLGELLQRPPRYGINAAAIPAKAGAHTYLRITDVNKFGQFAPRPKVGIRHPNAADFLLKPGELVFARTGASVGKSYLYNTQDGELVYASFFINIAPNPDLLDPRFLALFAQTQTYWDWVTRTSVRSSRPGINGCEYAQLLIPLPEIQDQRIIVKTATDISKLIDSLASLLAKKLAIKQGIMQQLLSGKIRLPGYHRKWHRRTLGDLGTFLKGHGITRDQVQMSGVSCIRYGEIYTTYRDYTSTAVSKISHSLAETTLPIENGDLLFASSGETRDEIGKCVAYTGSEQAVAGSDIAVFRGSGFNSVYLACLANTPAIARQKAQLSHGNTIVHLSSHALATIEMKLASPQEQDAIAAVILDAGTEIELLRRRLAKAKAIKQGILQELLPGRRLATLSDSPQQKNS